MALNKLNLTWMKVNRELDILAFVHPNQTCRILLNNPEFRQKMSDYILKTIPTQYLLIESPEEFYRLRKIIKCTTQEKTQIHNLVSRRFNELRNRKKPFSPPQISVNAHRFYSMILEE